MKENIIGPAKNLKDAYNAVLSDLKERNFFDAYYVNRPDSPVNEIKTRIELSKTPVKILFTGQSKSGKTTELFRLINELGDRYFTVYYSVFRDMEPADIEYQDLLILAALKLLEEVRNRKIRIDRDLTKLLLDWFTQITGEVIETKTEEKRKGIGLSGMLGTIIAKLELSFKMAATVRREVRTRLEPRVGELIEKIDMLTGVIKNETGKDPLLIIDDLEKIDPEKAEKIFYGHSQTLGRPSLRIIYLFPKHMTYTNEGRIVATQLSSPIHIPNIITSDRSGQPHEPGLDLLRQMILRRMEESLFEAKAFEYLLKTSNGVLSDLFSILSGACITALSRGDSKITWDDIDTGLKLLTDQFRRVIRENYYPTLAQVYKEKRTDNDQSLLDMLKILAVLEYRDKEGVFYDVHPAIFPLLKEKRLL